MRRWFPLGLVLGTLFCLNGCGGDGTEEIEIEIDPTSATVKLLATQQFTAEVTGTENTSVTWYVNDVQGGNNVVGTISTLGLYTAPANALNPSSVTVKVSSNEDSDVYATATVTIDSGATIEVSPSTATLGLGESVQFTAKVTNTVDPDNTAVYWLVNDVQGGNASTGSITTSGLYTAPTQIGTSTAFVVKASLQSDTSRYGTANVSVIAAGAPVLSSVNPPAVAQGSLFEDVYLTGDHFLSTSVARVNGVPVVTSFISTQALRARVPQDALGSAGTVFIDVQQQSGALSAALRLNVTASAPALISTSPDSTVQNGGAVSVRFDGGYYTPAMTAEFNGQPRGTTLQNSRQLSVAVTAQDVATAGLYSVSVRNTALPQEIAAANLAVEPSGSPTVLTTLGVGIRPSSVAIDTATGVAVVANTGSNSLSLIDLSTGLQMGSPVSVGTGPTGVAVDSLRNLAVVANNGDHSVSIVDLSLSPPALTMTLTSDIDFYPYAVGVNPLTGQALVVYQNSSKATIIDLNSLTVTGTSQITTTGPNPQVAIEPRLNWGIVTPGGSGSISIVSLSGQGRNVAALIAVPSSNGAKRSGGTVTITTTSAHRLSRDQEVVIAGVDDPSFNGTFTVESVPSSVTFTYTQSGPDETSGNGTVSAAAPLVTVALSSNIRGISINTETERAVLADPSSNSLTFMSALDQTVSTLALETGAVASTVNPLTNIAVTINSISNQASIIDLRTPRRLGTAIVGNNPQAVAIDPVTNVAVVANQSSNTVTLIHLGTIRSLHVTQMSPLTTLTTASDLTLTLLGNGFVSGSVVRLSEIPLQTTFVNARKLTAIVPASKLAAPHRYIIDVVNPDQSVSNVNDFVVMQAIPVGTAPRGVAIDPERDIAVVTNTGSDTVSVINLNNRSILGTLRVGDSPQGVAVLSRAGRAAVTNTDDDSVSIIDLDNIAVSATISVAPSSGTAKPIGVAIHPGSGKAVIANSNSSQVSFLNVQSPGTPTTLTVDTGPIAVAIDPTRNLAAVAHGSQSNVVIVDLDDEQIETRVTGFQLPTGAVYDPDSDQFVVASSLANNLVLIDPDSFAVTSVRVGINPTSVDSNYRSSTLVTANTSSQTVSVMNFPARTVEAILPLPVSQQFAIAVHPRTNQAVVVDQNNNRVLLVPLPK